MRKRKFNNENEWKMWVDRNLTDEPVIFNYGEAPVPNEFPCIMISEFIENPCTTEETEDQYYELIAQGYESYEIQMFFYDFVYPSDF